MAADKQVRQWQSTIQCSNKRKRERKNKERQFTAPYFNTKEWIKSFHCIFLWGLDNLVHTQKPSSFYSVNQPKITHPKVNPILFFVPLLMQYLVMQYHFVQFVKIFKV